MKAVWRVVWLVTLSIVPLIHQGCVSTSMTSGAPQESDIVRGLSLVSNRQYAQAIPALDSGLKWLTTAPSYRTSTDTLVRKEAEYISKLVEQLRGADQKGVFRSSNPMAQVIVTAIEAQAKVIKAIDDRRRSQTGGATSLSSAETTAARSPGRTTEPEKKAVPVVAAPPATVPVQPGIGAVKAIARTIPKTESELHAALKSANPNYTGTGKVYKNDKDGIWGMEISGCRVSTLEPLRGMPLTAIACADNDIIDLTPLKGMQLLQLVCNNNPITDISPISGMPIWKLGIKGTKVTDLTPLEGMKLQDFVFSPDNITKGIDIVRNMKTIQFYPTPEQPNKTGDGPYLMTLMSAEKFWKMYDEQQTQKKK